MGKQGTPNEGKKPGAPQGAPAGAPTQQAPAAEKKGAGAKVGCHASGCKDKDVRFNFCDEHFRQFKFGLITKSGDKVLDYDRKIDHYQKWKKTQKVA